jgi:hypothetical protein
MMAVAPANANLDPTLSSVVTAGFEKVGGGKEYPPVVYP